MDSSAQVSIGRRRRLSLFGEDVETELDVAVALDRLVALGAGDDDVLLRRGRTVTLAEVHDQGELLAIGGHGCGDVFHNDSLFVGCELIMTGKLMNPGFDSQHRNRYTLIGSPHFQQDFSVCEHLGLLQTLQT